MARPQTLQFLRHGRLLSGKVFRFFVETWNWIVRAFSNLRGDAELNGEEGLIYVDRSDPDAPVIRFRKDRLPHYSGQTVTVSADGPFSPVYDTEGEDPDVVTAFRNGYFMDAGATVYMSDGALSIPGTDGFIALKAGTTTATAGSASLACYPTLAALQQAQSDAEFFVVPLYFVAGSKIVLDLRRIPHVYRSEVLG